MRRPLVRSQSGVPTQSEGKTMKVYRVIAERPGETTREPKSGTTNTEMLRTEYYFAASCIEKLVHEYKKFLDDNEEIINIEEVIPSILILD
jgi:hypothetical protein